MSPKKLLKPNTKGNFLTSEEMVRELWGKYFPNIQLSETKWFQKYAKPLLEEGMRIAAKNREEGKQFEAEDEENIGKYVVGIIRNLVQRKPRPTFLATATVHFPASYQITKRDRRRFKARLTNLEGHQLFGDTATKTGYEKFWVNHRSVGAHVFAFFLKIGRLPDPNGLGGQNGLQIAHQCGVRNCCKPSHLRLTTKAVNLGQRNYPRKTTNQAQKAPGTHYGSTPSMPLSTAQGIPSMPSLGVYPNGSTQLYSVLKAASEAGLSQFKGTEKGSQEPSLRGTNQCPASPSDTEISMGGVRL